MHSELLSLNKEWDFAYLPEWDSQKLILPRHEEYCCKMPVPGYWDDHLPLLRKTEIWRSLKYNPVEPGPLRWPSALNPGDISLPYIIGVGFYKTSIKISEKHKNKLFLLNIGGAVLETWVFLNAKKIDYHLGHSTPFEIHLGELSEKENEIVIVVSNVRTDRRGSSLRGYAGRSAGIKGSVHLKIFERAQISAVYLRPNKEEDGILWRATLNHHNVLKKLKIAYQIFSQRNGALMGQGEFIFTDTETEWSTDRFGILPWSDINPHLYDIKIELWDNDNCLDSLKQTFGYRTLNQDSRNILLNNCPVYLRGSCEHHYFPISCTAHTCLEEYRENIRRLKAIGFNWLRFHTWVPPKEYLQAADELGMLVQIEPPVNSSEEEWGEIIRFCRVHPSVIIYCVGNEATLDENKIEQIRSWSMVQKSLAPDAYFSPQEAMHGVQGSNIGLDVVDKPFPHNQKRLNSLREFSDVFEPYEGALSHATMYGNWREMDSNFFIFKRPLFIHEIGIHGGYIDIGLEHRYDGTRIGSGLYTATRLHLAENNLLQMAATYFQNSCAHMRIQRKYAVENTRKCRNVSGYDFLGATDAHWHRTGYECGIMNEFYELKHGESKADVIKYNGESVLLIDCDTDRNFYHNATITFDALISHYGNEDIESANINWYLKDQGNLLISGFLQQKDIKKGEVTNLGSIKFDMPILDVAKKVTFVLRLNGGKYDIENEWNFWVFPSGQKQNISKSFLTVDHMNFATLEKLKNGERVLLLGNKPFPSMETHFMSSSSGRAGNHKGTVIHDHPLMRQFPHDGFCDLQFFKMLDSKAFPITFESNDMPFKPIIELISPYKRIRKISVLFEYMVGKGKLLVCALNLKHQDSGTEYFRNLIENYVASETFNPQASLRPEVLERFIASVSSVDTKFTTDEANDPNAIL